ncbi:diguanylate cyclase domain-containing protein [Rhodanobacter geophilus]|uniref:Diguanylate cyclase n=1 Tax=Rhodanobacter geophilus TaxID=3162488 RepID=A0ABV3QRT3_9GAMM
METTALTPLGKILDLLLDAICVVDAEGRYVFVSAAFERIFGYAPAEVIGRPMIELVHPDDRDITLRTAAAIMDGRPESNFQNRYVRKDGEVVHIMWSARWSEADRVRIAVAHDITALKRGESMRLALHAVSEAAHAAQDLPTLFEQVHRIIGGILPATNFLAALHDPAGNRVEFPYVARAHGPAPAAESLAADARIAEVIRNGRVVRLAPGASTGPEATHWLGVPLQSKDGTIGALVVEHRGRTGYTDADSELLQFVATQVSTAIERKQVQAKLHHLALHDPLTDLANRNLLRHHLGSILENAASRNAHVALLYIDLDGFKQVNDRYGHPTGDLLLCEVANRIRGCLREHDLAGRIGGDEFVVLLDALAAPGLGVDIAERIRAALGPVFHLRDHQVGISASIGVATFPADGDDGEQLARAADRAMYCAKHSGGNQTRVAADLAAMDAAGH